MLKTIQKYLAQPSAIDLAKQELALAQKSLLEAQSSQEYARKMAEYHQARISRLTMYLETQSTDRAITRAQSV